MNQATTQTLAITQVINASRIFRPFPQLTGYINTSTQKVPAPSLARRCAHEFGKAQITRCWLNLDEMWDYRNGQYNNNYRIGSRLYDDVPEKFKDSWGWAMPSNVHFDDYLRAFSEHSEQVMLTVRRYERDILDGRIGVTMADWKRIFKAAVIHAKEICPNLKYVEACNEYNIECFIHCTGREYYPFYQAAYQAINEVNAQLHLDDDERIFIGGSVVTEDRDPTVIVNELTTFFECFRDDSATDKRLDFVSWHEYHNRLEQTAHRQEQIRQMMRRCGLNAQLPLFITEHDPYHPSSEARQYNLINGAALVKSLYFTHQFSPDIKVMPWVIYHDGNIQTRFMWFEGPNEPDTRAEELVMLPAGCSMKLLGMHKQLEIAVDNDIKADHIVLASVQNDGMVLHVVNYGPARDVSLRIDRFAEIFIALGDGRFCVIKYLVDQEHSNHVNDADYPGGIEEVDRQWIQPDEGSIHLQHTQLCEHGIIFWELIPQHVDDKPITHGISL